MDSNNNYELYLFIKITEDDTNFKENCYHKDTKNNTRFCYLSRGHNNKYLLTTTHSKVFDTVAKSLTT